MKVTTNTSPSSAKVIETRYVWGTNIESCMNKAQEMCRYGRWRIEGNPAPMTWAGTHGTGVSISRVNDE
jgi:hypothetical protein